MEPAQHLSHFDFAIVGAGAAGLWLSQALLDSGLLETHRLCIIEAARDKGNDRTWCFWHEGPVHGVLQHCISHSWHHHRFQGQRRPLGPYRYHHVRSADFYDACHARLAAHPHVTHWHERALSARQDGQQVLITTSERVIRAGKVFSSVALPGDFAREMPAVGLWQSFVGWRVSCPAPVDDALRIMDFDIPQQGSVQFAYVLPSAGGEMLVEVTRFGPQVISSSEAHEILAAYLSRAAPGYTILETESGRIPMSAALNNPDRHHAASDLFIPIGTVGGAIKPSTGYGFLTMRQHAQAIAQALRAQRPIPKVYRQQRHRLYDALLLQILAEQPEQGKPIFERLLRRQPIARVFRFLDERTSLAEEARLFSVLPIALFLRALLQYLLPPKKAALPAPRPAFTDDQATYPL